MLHALNKWTVTNAIALIKFLAMLYEETIVQNDHVSCLTLSPPEQSETIKYSNHGTLSDPLLWNAFKKGDELAFIEIYKRYYEMLFNYGCKYSTDKELVRDCLQDFFLYLRKNKLGLGNTNCIKLYLFKAFRRRIIEYLRKNSYLFSSKEPSEYAQFAVESSIEAVYINKQIKAEQLEKLNQALNALDQKEKKAIYYFFFKGFSYEQIAEMFQFSHVSSARRVMYRSLRQLRNFF